MTDFNDEDIVTQLSDEGIIELYGVDHETGEFTFDVDHDLFAAKYPAMHAAFVEAQREEAEREVAEALENLQRLGLVERVDDDSWQITDLGKALVEENANE